MPPRKLHELRNRLEPGDVVAEQLQPNQIPPGPAARQQNAVSRTQESTVEMGFGRAQAGSTSTAETLNRRMIDTRRLQLVAPKQTGSREETAVSGLVQAVG